MFWRCFLSHKETPSVTEIIKFITETLALKNRYFSGAHSISDIKISLVRQNTDRSIISLIFPGCFLKDRLSYQHISAAQGRQFP